MIAAAASSPASASLARTGGEASSPRASSVRGTSAMRASTSPAVLSHISHRLLCAGKSPYSAPSVARWSASSEKCRASSLATWSQAR
ncbi:hypothetical protein D3C86_1967960 [compost metagenome]